MSDLITINTNCLEEAIRCAICKNPIKTKRGCDGSCQYEKEMLSKVIDAVEGLAIEHQFGEWIPCSEKLPEDDKEVLVYVRRKDGKESEMNGLHIARKNRIEGDPEGNNNFWGVPVAPCEWRIEGWSYFFEPKVLAWMELPEPYRKEGE